jgi:ABC-type sulfate/molybdate transport systems ATPase subunit
VGTAVARLIDVRLRRGQRVVIDRLNLEVRRGEQLALLGPSGAGKSTVLKLLTGQLQPTTGTVDFPGETRREGVVHQDPLLFDWLTVAENIGFGQRLQANQVDRDRVRELLELLDLTEIAAQYPDEISGGQAQRTSLARALAVHPDLLLLDEPFSALDPATRSELQTWLRTAVVRDGLTSLIVTHDIDEALILADRIVLLGSGGTITHRWDNVPATDHSAALVHPLRTEIRLGYADVDDYVPEADDEEWSGPLQPGVNRG